MEFKGVIGKYTLKSKGNYNGFIRNFFILSDFFDFLVFFH